MVSTGLYLGKFAPLHEGHQFVIESALEGVDELYVIIYDVPDVIDVPLTVRERWINELYPSVNTIQAWNAPMEEGYTEEIKRKHEEYTDSLLPDDVDVTHYYSSEKYGGHMSDYFDAVDRRVDPERETVPISGTEIRGDVYSNRDFLSDRVYSDLITRVAIVGGPSTGKSTLVEELADYYDTSFMYEYCREYWEENAVDGRLTVEQLVEICEGHFEREEDRICDARDYFFSDTTPLTVATLSKYYHGFVPEEIESMVENSSFRYDLHILCDTDIPYDDTEERSGEDKRERFQKHNISLLEEYGIPYFVVSGSVEERVSEVSDILEDFDKWDFEW
jgi:NadR type nicotinamide-nucleotide adenylyltransferase